MASWRELQLCAGCSASMPTTRAPRTAARAAAARVAAPSETCLLLDLPTELLKLIVVRISLAHDIAAVAPTCYVLCDAAKIALKARPFSSEVVTLAGDDPAYAVATAPDGRVITGLSGYGDGKVMVWRDGACEPIEAHADWVWAVAVLPGGTRFVSVSRDKTAKLWTLDGDHERTFEVGSWVTCVAALPDGVHFVVGLRNKEVRLYHVDGTFVHAFTGHNKSVFAVTVTPDGQHIISGSADKRVKVWNVANKSLLSTCTGHEGHVNAVAAMPDGQRFLSAAAGMHDYVRVWLLDGTLKDALEVHTGGVQALVALPDNQHALAGAWDKTVKLFNVNGGAVLRTITRYKSPVTSLALLPDGLRFVSGSEDKNACIAYHGLAPFAAATREDEETQAGGLGESDAQTEHGDEGGAAYDDPADDEDDVGPAGAAAPPPPADEVGAATHVVRIRGPAAKVAQVSKVLEQTLAGLVAGLAAGLADDVRVEIVDA